MNFVVKAFLLLCVCVGFVFAQVRGTFTDPRDGRNYQTVNINGTVWMARNLNFEMGSSACYNNVSGDCGLDGRLYNWDDAMSACPSGWRLPNNEDWSRLARAAGGRRMPEANYANWPGVGDKLKASNTWGDGREGTNQFHFSARPSGMRTIDGFGRYNGFHGHGRYGNWWSASWGPNSELRNASAWMMAVGNKDLGENYGVSMDQGYSVRCIHP